MSNEMIVTFPGGKRVAATYSGFEIVTDQSINLAGVEDFLEHLEGDDYYRDEYHACVTGGSTGLHGVPAEPWLPEIPDSGRDRRLGMPRQGAEAL